MDAPGGESVDQKRVDRTEGKVTCLSARLTARVVENPAHLRAAKIGIENQPGTGTKVRLEPTGFELFTERVRAPTLPHDRRINGVAGAAFPDDRCLALVRDPDRGDVHPRGSL